MSDSPQDLAALMPFAQQLGMTVDEASADRVVARLAWSPRLCTVAGVMHGGALMSLADTAGALVAFLGLPDGATTATITSTTQLLRPVTGGTVRAVAVPLHAAGPRSPRRPACTTRTTGWSRRPRRYRRSARPCDWHYPAIATESILARHLMQKPQPVAKLRYSFDCSRMLVAR
jgi:uncharacterized protein (TIGR00369 family)